MPVKLHTSLRHLFSTVVMMRGREYFDEKRVVGIQLKEFGASAQVLGDQNYVVSAAWPKGLEGPVQMECACPHFMSGQHCKHLWAFLLTLDEQNDAAPVGSDWRAVFRAPVLVKKELSKSVPRDAFLTIEADAVEEGSVRFKLFAAQLYPDGSASRAKPIKIPENGEIQFGDDKLRALVKAIATLAFGEVAGESGYSRYRFYHDSSARTVRLGSLRFLLPALFESQRVFARIQDFGGSAFLKPVHFGRLRLKVTDYEQGHFLSAFVLAKLHEGGAEELIPLSKLHLLAAPNLFRYENHLGFVELSENEKLWVEELSRGSVLVPFADDEPFLDAILNQELPVELPKSLAWERLEVEPSARLELRLKRDRHVVDLKFKYGPRSVSYASAQRELPAGESKQIYLRSPEKEAAVFAQLPFVERSRDDEDTVPSSKLLELVKAAFALGLPVEIENQNVAQAETFQLSVNSGVDWFEVGGQAEYGSQMVHFPTILEAIRRGEKFVPLADGSLGLINEEMRERLEKLAFFADKGKDGFKFTSAQGLLLNSLLEGNFHLQLDAKFKALRENIAAFSGVKPLQPSKTFVGQLRIYQKEGLGWLEFLNEFGLGGILADDMGLGKTIQCLAFLEGRRARHDSSKPSLLLAPKSLLENWRTEATKFTPEMRVLIHTGTARKHANFTSYDLIVTTYQTMLRDVEALKAVQWDCIVADEAQAIKNPEALISKAAKVLPAHFRLAMTGTPIENSIHDLFSISDFVNPGFLNGKKRSENLKLTDESRATLATAFKPVILRRTKEEVLKDLPEKTEQLISVELEPKQLKVYNDLKRFYQSQLLKEVHDRGIKKSQIQILAALTRLRQAALHPALIDPTLTDAKSSKFEIVLSMLEEIIAEGHRVLIFSQFTSLLSLLKKELNLKEIKFAYLDGKTVKREAVVNEFRESTCPVFLMSLKAGGVGLNLVEADYVFLLDPWWNPAVEAQAIDRVHRIGQKRAVFAYRFIAKNTVEEKILELQNTKRGLAGDIFGQKGSTLRSLTAADIENLFN